jgi:hypothetical protein
MKRLKVLTALAIGIMSSSSGVIQAKAALYVFSVDFATKEVADFDAYVPSFSGDTYGLNNSMSYFFITNYFMSSCPVPNIVTNARLAMQYSTVKNTNGSLSSAVYVNLPDMPCTTTSTAYYIEGLLDLPNSLIDDISVPNNDYRNFRIQFEMFQNSSLVGLVTTLRNTFFNFVYNYEFGTTYLFNNFLSDNLPGAASWQTLGNSTMTDSSTKFYYLAYVYSTAGNDEYRIINSNLVNIGTTTRKKYAINYQDEFFRGDTIGVAFEHYAQGDMRLTVGTTGLPNYRMDHRIYFLNAANNQEEIVDVPVFTFEEEDCGSFLALNVGCFVNNAFAYIVNDAPIISDAFTLLNAGIEMAAQTFGIIGNFADDNVFGVLILAGFGFIAVKWFLKND